MRNSTEVVLFSTQITNRHRLAHIVTWSNAQGLEFSVVMQTKSPNPKVEWEKGNAVGWDLNTTETVKKELPEIISQADRGNVPQFIDISQIERDGDEEILAAMERSGTMRTVFRIVTKQTRKGIVKLFEIKRMLYLYIEGKWDYRISIHPLDVSELLAVETIIDNVITKLKGE